MHFRILFSSFCLASCAAAPSHLSVHEISDVPMEASLEMPTPVARSSPYVEALQSPPAPRQARSNQPEWRVGQSILQGFFGVTEYERVSLDDGSGISTDGDAGDLDQMPVIGGGAQHKLGGESIDYGFEGFFAFGGRGNASAFVVGGGGAAVAIDVDLLVFDLYGGLFASKFLGEKMRVYASAGPLLEWANYDQSNSTIDDNGSGFGLGTYARTGVEFVLAGNTMAGFAVRWSDCTLDLSGGLGDLEMKGVQLLFTVSRGL